MTMILNSKRFNNQRARGKFSRRLKKLICSPRTLLRMLEEHKESPKDIELLEDLEDLVILAYMPELDYDAEYEEITDELLDSVEELLEFN